MAKPKAKKPPPAEDEAQSRRFLEDAAAIQADGGLSDTEAERVFDQMMGRVRLAKFPKQA